MKRLLLALMLLTSTAAHAGDTAKFIPIGFSPDGRYYAFGQNGIQDGSGAFYASVAVVEVEKNTFAASKTVILGMDEDTPIGSPELALEQAAKEVNLARFNIANGKNLGTDLLVRQDTDYSTYTNTVFSYTPNTEYTANKYEVKIETKNGPDNTEGQWCSGMIEAGAPQMLKLTLQGLNNVGGFTQVMQDDQNLPTSRNCVESYSAQRVTTFKEGVVIAVAYSGPGFEGPDVRWMVVTGQFKGDK